VITLKTPQKRRLARDICERGLGEGSMYLSEERVIKLIVSSGGGDTIERKGGSWGGTYVPEKRKVCRGEDT